MRKVTNRVTLIVLMLICVVTWRANGHQEKICGSIVVRNNMTAFDQLINCTVIEGSLRIVMLEKTTEYDFVNLTFDSLREITHYLIVFRVKGLNSLGQLFPNLSLIRGTELFSNVALGVYENSKLQELGLHSLTHIKEGSVFIRKNYNLCFASSIDWSRIMNPNNSNQTFYEVIIREEKDEKECDTQRVCGRCPTKHCWSAKYCQKTDLGECHPLCAGGCTQLNSTKHCFACRGLLTEDGNCVENCPPNSYEYRKRSCLSEESCRNTRSNVTRETYNGTVTEEASFFVFEKYCVHECPSRYYRDEENARCVPCEGDKCRKVCVLPVRKSDRKNNNATNNNNINNTMGVHSITSVGEAKVLQTCTHIQGSLTIEGITGKHSAAIEQTLQEGLGMIEEISGQLKIIHSHALKSLNFLASLHTIEGKHINVSSYNASSLEAQQTLVVKDNKNLQHLWDWEKRGGANATFRIVNEKIFFHFNPKLCMSEIEKLAQVANMKKNFKNFSLYEVSRESNGDQTMCGSFPLNVTIEKREAHGVILALHIPTNATSDKTLVRFMVFYKERGDERINAGTQFEWISECSDTRWRKASDALRSLDDGHNGTYYIILPHLEPATEYVYFVRSMYSTILTSPLQSVITLPDQPTVPLALHVNYTGDTSVVLKWKPPYHSHGRLKNYVIRGYYETDRRPDLLTRDYCTYSLRGNEKLTLKPTTTTPLPPPPSTGGGGGGDDKNGGGNCRCKNETEKDPSMYCNSFEHEMDLDPKKRVETGMETCDAYLRKFVDTNYARLISKGPVDEFDKVHNEQKSIFTQMPNFENGTGEDGRLNTFQLEVNANTTWVLISNLRHFSEYIVSVTACPEEHAEIPAGVPCSRDAMLAFRTEPDRNADIIDESRLHVGVYNQTTNITWEEPTVVNSFVHSYLLEYRNKDVENSKYIDTCITANAFRASNNTYSIDNLSPGRYELRLRAISLAGEGPYANKTFLIEERGQGNLSIIISCILVAVVIVTILIVVAYYCHFRGRKLYASVNPDYEEYQADHWEVPRENLTLLRQLGRGRFGSVHEGLMQPNNVKCAVKTVQAVVEADNHIFLKEATIMKAFSNAFHIVRLLGVVSKGRPVYVIMELMEFGDLKSFLLRYGGQFCDDDKMLLPSMLIKMAAQIADGMAFLEVKKFVHRDLAARNCMVAADYTCKVGDFGLARDIYSADYYRKGETGTLPIRWMPPESIRDGVYDSHSDMWSYGVVLWEMATFAQLPYHPRSNEEVIKYVQSGRTLDIPENMHQVLRPIMRNSWKWHPSQRPTFAQVLKILDPYVDDAFRKVSYFHNGELPNVKKNVIPFHSTVDYYHDGSDEPDEINLHLGHSPGASTSTSTSTGQKSFAVRYHRIIPNNDEPNGHVDNIS